MDRPLITGVVLAVIVAGASGFNPRPMAASLQQPGPPAAASVLDGVFTADQATRGQQTFQTVCSACHTLAEHTGPNFTAKWGGTSVGDMFELISNTMPDGNPGSLKPDEYAEVIAYFLKETGYPAGKQELPAESAALMNVRIVPLAK